MAYYKIKECPLCGVEFSYKVAIGNDRIFCSKKCAASANKLKWKNRSYEGLCSASGCCLPANRIGAKLCEKHYIRMRRTGCLDIKKVTHRCLAGGYVRVKRSTHPLVNKGGWMYEHREVAYDTNNGVCPTCFWCNVDLKWGYTHIDHLDDNKINNKPENLVVSCPKCNRIRGAMKSFIQRLSIGSFEAFVSNARALRAAALLAAS